MEVRKKKNVKKINYFSLSTNKKFIHIHFFQLYNEKFVYNILGHCSGAEQLPDQMFG